MSMTLGEKSKAMSDAITGITKGAGEISKAAAEGGKAVSTAMEILGAVGKLSPYFGIAGGVLGVFNIFCPNPFQTEVINYLKDIDDKLDDLEKHIDQQLDKLGKLIDADFFKEQLSQKLGQFNIDMTQFPIGYDKNDLTWSNFVELDGFTMGQTYTDIQSVSNIGNNIANIRAQLTGDKSADQEQDEVTTSVLGLIVDRAIREMDGSKGLDQRGCMQSSDDLLNRYLAIESFFCKNFLVEFKSYKMWHDAVIYFQSLPYPLTADSPVKDDNSNVDQILQQDTTTYNSKGIIPDYICVGSLGASYKYKPGDEAYAAYDQAINNWGDNALRKSASYSNDNYQNYFQKFKNGTLPADSTLFIFINRTTLIDLLKAQEALTDQLDFFVFQTERLVISQMNLAAGQSTHNKVADFESTANQILSRAEYIRQSLSGNVYQVIKDTEVKPGDPKPANASSASGQLSSSPFLTGRVVLPNNVQLACGTIGKTGDLGAATPWNYKFGYGHDFDKTGFGYQFPIIDGTGAIKSYADSWMTLHTYNFSPDTKLPDLTDAGNRSVMVKLAAGNFDGREQPGDIFVHTFTLGSESKTLYSFFVTPLFGGLEATELLTKNYQWSNNEERKGVWNDSSEADVTSNPMVFTMKGSTPTGNGADDSDFLTLGVSIPVNFDGGGMGMNAWAKATLTIDVNFTPPPETQCEELVINTRFLEHYQCYNFYDDYRDNQHTENSITIISNPAHVEIVSDSPNESGFALSTSSLGNDGTKLSVGSLQHFPGSGSLSWVLDAMGGPNDPWDYTFDGFFKAVVKIEDIHLCWDMPDTSKFA